MNKYVRRSMIGLLAGAISSVILVETLQNSIASLFFGCLVGCIYAMAFHPTFRAYIDSVVTAAAVGIGLWGIFSVIVLPLLSSHLPQWSSEEMRHLFPMLVGWVLYGASMGLLTQAMNDLVSQLLGPEYQPRLPERIIQTRILIVGGGFAGMTTAAYLERAFGADSSVSLTLVSDTNSLLFTPMLAEVAGGSLEPQHICNPLRTSLRRTQVIHARVEQVKPEQKSVILSSDGHSRQPRELCFDHLVLAVGSVSNYLGLTGVEETAFDFKSLGDAIRIREHVIDLLERAEDEPDPIRRQAMLTFVIAGGGFAGAELAGALNDFVRGALPYYPTLSSDEVQVILIHSRDTILPELSPSLGRYALERMTARGVTFKLNTRLKDAREGVAILQPVEELRTETIVWTAGVKPHPLVQVLPAAHDQRGALIVDKNLAIPQLPGIWALGDCAQVTDGKTGKPCPPTAQFALREAATLAHNIHASVRGRPLKPFHFEALGALCVVGHHTACAEIKGLRFSGFFAWLLWRGIYLSKLPGLERKLRVLGDWTIELFFPRDIVQTLEVDIPDKRRTGRTMSALTLGDKER